MSCMSRSANFSIVARAVCPLISSCMRRSSGCMRIQPIFRVISCSFGNWSSHTINKRENTLTIWLRCYDFPLFFPEQAGTFAQITGNTALLMVSNGNNCMCFVLVTCPKYSAGLILLLLHYTIGLIFLANAPWYSDACMSVVRYPSFIRSQYDIPL